MEHTLESSKTLFFILVKMSFAASTKASSTLCPDLALASTKRRPSWRANSAPSSVVTWRGFNGARVKSQIQWPTRIENPQSSESQRSILLPTRMHVRWGSACSRTSASHDFVFTKPGCVGSMYDCCAPVHQWHTFPICDIIDKEATCCAAVIRTCNGPERLCPCCVPALEFDNFVVFGNRDKLGAELDS